MSQEKWTPFVQQPFWVSHYGKMPYNCFIRLRGKPSIWNKLVAALSYFFLMKSWQLGSAFLMWFCTLCVSIYLIVFFSCQWVHMYTYPQEKIHYLLSSSCQKQLPSSSYIRYLVWPSLKSIAHQCGYYKAWNSFVDFVANVCFLIWRNAYLVTD